MCWKPSLKLTYRVFLQNWIDGQIHVKTCSRFLSLILIRVEVRGKQLVEEISFSAHVMLMGGDHGSYPKFRLSIPKHMWVRFHIRIVSQMLHVGNMYIHVHTFPLECGHFSPNVGKYSIHGASGYITNADICVWRSDNVKWSTTYNLPRSMRPGCWLLSFKSLGFLPKPVTIGDPWQVTHEDFNMDLFLENEEFPFRHLSFTRIYHTCGVWWSQVPVIFASGILDARPCCSAFSFGLWWNHWWKRHQIRRTPHSPTRFHGHLQVRFHGFAMANFWSRLFLLVCIFS